MELVFTYGWLYHDYVKRFLPWSCCWCWWWSCNWCWINSLWVWEFVWRSEERWGGGRCGGTTDGLIPKPADPEPRDESSPRKRLFSTCGDPWFITDEDDVEVLNSCLAAAAAAAAATARSGNIDWCIAFNLCWLKLNRLD